MSGEDEKCVECAYSKCIPQRMAAFMVSLAQRKHPGTYICSAGAKGGLSIKPGSNFSVVGAVDAPLHLLQGIPEMLEI